MDGLLFESPYLMGINGPDDRVAKSGVERIELRTTPPDED